MAATKTLGSGAAALVTSAQGFGCMGITAFYGKAMHDDDAVKLMMHAFQNGVTHFDTAEVYTCTAEDGKTTVYNETVVGKAIRLMGRENVQIATKYYPGLHGDKMEVETVMAAARASCERLGVDCVDLYYVHRIHSQVTVEEQAVAMKAVADAGLTKHVGLSEFSAANVKRFHAICPVTCVQQEWSLMNRDLEPELVPACRELGIGIVAYSPLCRSLLSGDVRTPADLKEGDLRAARYPRFAPENLENNAAIAKGVKAIAVGRGVSAAQLSLAWVSNQGDDVVPIPGTTKILHLDDNLASMSVVLNKEERDLIAASVDSSNVAGGRYPGGVGAGTFADQGINQSSL